MSRVHLLGKSNHALRPLRKLLVALRRGWLRRRWGMDIDPSCEMSLSAKFDTVYPAGIHIGPDSYIAFDVHILTHDMTRGLYLHTRIGTNCFIGGRSLIMPGMEIGDGCIVGAGSVVTKSVPPGCIVAGNPARIIRENIKTGRYGRMDGANATETRFFETAASQNEHAGG